MNNTEILFIVEEDPEGGYNATAPGHNIFTQGDTMEELKEMIKDAIICHFEDESKRPKLARLHFVKDEVFAVA
jgi:predicted RNase H-like HicB family nuclease